MSDRDRSSPSLTDTPLKTYIGRHDDDYPLINGNGEYFLEQPAVAAAAAAALRPLCRSELPQAIDPRPGPSRSQYTYV